MKAIQKKLLSKRGASMILALVFLLFCTFVGGSVLAVAAANSARIRHLTAEEQQFLNQRSAVRLIREALTQEYKYDEAAAPINPPTMRLTVHVVTTKTQPVIIGNGGVVTSNGPASEVTRYIFTANNTDHPKPAIQRMVYESAILRALAEGGTTADAAIIAGNYTLENLVFQELNSYDSVTLSSLEDLWLYKADDDYLIQVTVQDSSGNVLDDTVTARLICEGGEDAYDFWVTFGQNGEEAQASLRLRAMVSRQPPQQGAPYYRNSTMVDGVEYADQITDTTETIVITWSSNPTIVKGGID